MATGLVLAVLGSSGGWVPSAEAAPAPGARLWRDVYASPHPADDMAEAVVASPDGATVYVAGSIAVGPSAKGYGTVAHDSVTGARRWTAQHGSGGPYDRAMDIAINSAGTALFEVGVLDGTLTTVSYDAATGAPRWGATYPAASGRSVVVSPNGQRVYVTGTTASSDYVTISYNSATGAQLWARTYNGPAGLDDTAYSIGVSPDGATVVVTGTSRTRLRDTEILTIAYRTTSGATAWFNRFNAEAGKHPDTAEDLVISPNGGSVTVAGAGYRPADGWGYVAVSYDMVTGAERWAATFLHPDFVQAYVYDIALTPDGTSVILTGAGYGAPGVSGGFITAAYDAATGAQEWSAVYRGPVQGRSIAYGLAVSPDGTQVVVTGSSYGGQWLLNDTATVAYDVATGAQQWASRMNRAIASSEVATDVVMAGPGRAVIVGHTSLWNDPSAFDYLAAAYQL